MEWLELVKNKEIWLYIIGILSGGLFVAVIGKMKKVDSKLKGIEITMSFIEDKAQEQNEIMERVNQSVAEQSQMIVKLGDEIGELSEMDETIKEIRDNTDQLVEALEQKEE